MPCARQARELYDPERIHALSGSDIDQEPLTLAKRHIVQAQLGGRITLTQQPLETLQLSGTEGVFIANPPYGERLSDRKSCERLYGELRRLKERHPGCPSAPYPATRALSAVMAAVQTRCAGCTMADWSVTSLFINDTHANKSRASRRKHGSCCASADFYVSAGGLRVDAYAIFHAQIREMVAYVTYAAFSREMNAGRILGQADVHIPAGGFRIHLAQGMALFLKAYITAGGLHSCLFKAPLQVHISADGVGCELRTISAESHVPTHALKLHALRTACHVDVPRGALEHYLPHAVRPGPPVG